MSEAEAFVLQWGLDSGSHSLLTSLSPELQAAVYAGFSPKPHTQNVDRLFHGYVKSLQLGPLPNFGQPEVVLPPSGFEAPLEPPKSSAEYEMYSSWCMEQGLDQVCLETLMSLSPEQRIEASSRFSPKPGTRNPVGLFLGFCRSLREGPLKGGPKGAGKISHHPADGTGTTETYGGDFTADGAAEDEFFMEAVRNAEAGLETNGTLPLGEMDEEVSLFLKTWGLDNACASMLRNQSADVQRHVLDTFAPKPGTRNVNSLFMGFIRSFLAGAGCSAGGNSFGAAAAQSYGVSSAPDNTTRIPRAFAGGTAAVPATPAWGRSGPSEQEVRQFARTWDLDQECVSSLMQCTGDHMQQVMDSFRPKPGTRNVKSLFMGFLRSIGYRLASERDQTVGGQRSLGGSSWGSGGSASYGGNGSHGVILPGRPGAWSGGGGGGGKGYGGGYGCGGGGASCSGGYGGSMGGGWRQEPKGGASIKRPLAGGGGGGGCFASTEPSEEELNNFMLSWGLDSEAMMVMQQQAPDVQQQVMNGFSPKQGTRDVKSLFMGFLKSMVLGPSAKRPRWA